MFRVLQPKPSKLDSLPFSNSYSSVQLSSSVTHSIFILLFHHVLDKNDDDREKKEEESKQ